MTNSCLLKLLPLGIMLGLGCGELSDLAPVPNPPRGYPAAFATPDCAPWDGRALTVVLAESPTDSLDGTYPQLWITVYPRGEAVAGRSFHWPETPEAGAGRRCLVARPCEAAASGEIRFRPTHADTALEGSLVLRFGTGDSVYGGFRAEWRPRQVFCG